MPKQNLIALAQHSGSVVPVGQLLGVYAKETTPDGSFTAVPDTAHPATHTLNKAIAAWGSAKYWLFNIADTYLNGVLASDVLLRVTNLESVAKAVRVIQWIPSLVKTITCAGTTNGDTILIGDVTYTFMTALTTSPATIPNEILVGNGGTDAAANLVLAITGGAGMGTNYSVDTVANQKVTASVADAVVTITQLVNNSSMPYRKIVSIGENIPIVPSNLTRLAPNVTIATDTNNRHLRTLLTWTPTAAGEIVLPAGLPYDLYLPAYGDLYNSSGGALNISFTLIG